MITFGMSLRRVVVVAALPLLSLLSTGDVKAASAGQYYCEWCSSFTEMVDSDAMIFLKSEVNKDLQSWRKGNQNKNVTICNDSVCAVYQYTANGNFILKSVGPNTRPRAVGGGGVGGRPGGGGGWVGGGGSVTVGPITKPPTQTQAN